jgi:hypothetical protein
MDFTPTRGLKISTYTAFFLLILGVFACDLRVPLLSSIDSGSLVHITEATGLHRWRSFSTEPSMFSATVVSLGLASAYLSRKKFNRIFFVTLTLLLLLASQSKGGLLVLGLGAFVVLFLKRPSILRLAFYFAICSLLAAVSILLIMRTFSGIDMFDATVTIATRGSLAVWVFIVLAHHPWGVGFSGFYQALTIYLPAAMDFMSRISPFPLNFIEVQSYVNEAGAHSPLDAKCFFLEYLASFGIPFLIAYVSFGVKVVRALLDAREDLLLVAFIFLFIGFSTYVNGVTLYAAFYTVGLAYRECRIRAERAPKSHVKKTHLEWSAV